MKKTTEQFITSDGMVMYLQCFVPFHYKERNTAAALIVPGGQCAPEDYNWISSTLCRRGYLVYSIYQRGYGSGAPRVNDHAGERQLQDLKEAFEFVKGQPLVDQDRIVVIGHSYGADMVQRLALEKKFACGVVLSQLSDWLTYAKYAKEFLPDYYRRACEKYGGDPFEHPEGYILRSTLQHADKIKVPMLAITGDRDNITPAVWAEKMTRALNAAGNTKSKCVVVENAGHFFEHFGFHGDQRAEVVDIIVEWLNEMMPAEVEGKEF